MGHALRTAFDLLNLNRLVSGIDNYGQVFDTHFAECVLSICWVCAYFFLLFVGFSA